MNKEEGADELSSVDGSVQVHAELDSSLQSNKTLQKCDNYSNNGTTTNTTIIT